MSDDSAFDPVTPPPSKLTQTKTRWAQDHRLPARRADRPESARLPPGQHRTEDWPVLDLGEQPVVSTADWRLELFGAVDHPVIWDWTAFTGQTQIDDVSDIHCVTSWSRYDNRWSGVSTQDLLAAVAPHDAVRHVLLHSHDGYTTNLTIEDFAAEGVLLAHSWQGKPLSSDHGGPVRLIVPHLYFWKSAKWIRRIEFRENDAPGFWEQRGYHNRGNPWTEERYG